MESIRLRSTFSTLTYRGLDDLGMRNIELRHTRSMPSISIFMYSGVPCWLIRLSQDAVGTTMR